MTKTARFLCLMVLGVAGLASIVATSPPPPATLYLISENNFETDRYRYGYRYFDGFACRDEKATLKWSTYEEDNIRLSAKPAENITPQLQNKRVEREGELAVTILGDAEITLDAGNNDGYLNVGLIPDELCTGHSFPVVGWYKGLVQQTSPTQATLERHLSLVWRSDGKTGFLGAQLTTNLLTPNYSETSDLICNYESVTSGFSCKTQATTDVDVNPAETLELEFGVNEDGVVGTYTGQTALGLEYRGSFNMQKQSDPPESPTPETP